MRILIVEDKRAFAGHIGRALASEGHSIELAYDGREALRLGRTAAFDLMLLDVMLPCMDGFTVIRKLREDRLQTQTILVSARDSMEDIIQGLDAGADDYLTKPFALDVLLAKVRATERRIPLAAPQTLYFEDLILRPHLCKLQRGSRSSHSPALRPRCWSWISDARIGAVTPLQRRSFPPVCPEFLVEILSESDSRSKLEAKMEMWIENGALLAWMIDPFAAEVIIYRPGQESERLLRPHWIEADAVVPGFRLETSRLWAK